MWQWIRKYSWKPSWTVNMKILPDIRVTVTFRRAFQPSAGLSYWKIRKRQMCMKWLFIIRHVYSFEQRRIVSTVSTVSTDIARCYLHLRWYFLSFHPKCFPKWLVHIIPSHETLFNNILRSIFFSLPFFVKSLWYPKFFSLHTIILPYIWFNSLSHCSLCPQKYFHSPQTCSLLPQWPSRDELRQEGMDWF